MNVIRPYYKKQLVLAIAAFTPLISLAQDAVPANNQSSNSFNPMLVGLVSLVIILLMAIGIIANVLRQLGFVYREKMHAEGNSNSSVIKTMLLLVALSIPAIHSLAQETTSATPTAAPVSNMISGIPKGDFYLLMIIIGLELLVIISLTLTIRVMVRLISRKPELEPVAKAIIRKPFWEKLNKTVAIEQENDIMLEHDYDGIRELDNSLPPWWKYGFYFTILVSIVYLYRFHVSHTAPSSLQEYADEMKQAEVEHAAYLANAANKVDENTVTFLTASADIDAGKQIFESTCFACHAKDGGGGVGPNLTDDYWLHGGSIKDVFKSIKYGWQDKGMKSWQNDFSPKQIAQIASYVKSLHGTKPAAPKDKQGELYIEGGKGNIKDSSNKVAQN